MANPAMTALLALLVAPQMLQGVVNTFPPFGAGMARKGYRDRPNLIPSSSELVGLRLKDVISEPAYLKLMREAGFDPEMAQDLLANARNYLSVFDYVSLWRRGDITRERLDDLLGQMGFDARGITDAINATIYYPTPQDLVRFSVREVYTPATAELYGLFEDYPANFDEVAGKAGLTPEIARWYWAAHWELPSPTQVYEMNHRGIIKEADVKEYLKSADYMPFWRDKLIKLSYDPYTRVDVRRMYALGILTEAQVFTAYKDLGYDDEKAANLTRFTVKDTEHSDENTPKSNTVAAYKAGVIDRAQALAELVSNGYTEGVANVQLDTADAQIKTELIDLQADGIIDQYRRGGITLDQVRMEFTRIGVPARMMQLTIERELAQARKRSKHATKSDVDAWWMRGFLSDARYLSMLEDMGYDKRTSNLYLAEQRIEELKGDNKKETWVPYMRDYLDGKIGREVLRNELVNLELADNVIHTLLSVVDSIQG